MDKQTTKGLLADFAAKVTLYRKINQKMSLNELAKKADVSSVTLSQIEKNELENCSISKLIDVAHACDIKLAITAEVLPVTA